MTKAHSFSATPTPAEGMVPMELAMAMITRKVRFTNRSCSATGLPSFRILPMRAPLNRMSCRRRVKARCFFRISSRESTTLTAWANTVAMAAPATFRPKPPTSSRSPPMFRTHAISTVISGTRESPIPRKMLPSRL